MVLLQLESFFFEKLQASVHYFLVIENASVLRDFFQGLIDTEGRTIRSVRRHCLNYISHSYNFGFKENFITL